MTTTVFVGTSLDGFIARLDGSFDFLLAGEGEPHGYEEFMATVDAVVLGRNTYDVVLGLAAWPYGKTPVFVLTTRPLGPPPPGTPVERLSGPLHGVVADLESRGFGHIYIDGGNTIQQFLAAGLVHRIIVTRVPVLIGSGIALFGVVPYDIRLSHLATRQFPNGLVQSEYLVAT